MNIVGISSHYHDAACCILKDGVLVAAAEEERFSRLKHDPATPYNAFRYCLSAANLTIADIDGVAFYEQPYKKAERQIWMAMQALRSGEAAEATRDIVPSRIDHDVRRSLGYDGPLLYFDHHVSHAASAYFYSGFRDAAILTVDGVGEWTTLSFGSASAANIDLFQTCEFPHSIGLLYSAMTSYLGFEVNEGEYKVMGLAPYGRPLYLDEMSRLVASHRGGDLKLDLDYFGFIHGDAMFSDALCDLIGGPPRSPGQSITQFHKDVARSLQQLTEDLLLEKVRFLHDRVPSANLCMAGGVALNCVANGRIRREGPFSDMFVQPAAGDAGCALGAAALAHVELTGEAPNRERLANMHLGPRANPRAIAGLLSHPEAVWHSFADDEQAFLDAVVQRLVDGKIVGWFQDRMEFGPRALGGRSILADPRRPDVRDRINLMIKKREDFRPFAPAVLAEHASEHFDIDHPSPFMLETCQVRSPLSLPGITHVDGSARVQTVDPSNSPGFHALIESFHRRTGCPILLNTSFNIKGMPIVCEPEEAMTCFIRSDLDCLAIEGRLIDREGLPSSWCDLYRNTLPRERSAIRYDVYSFF